MRSAFAAFALCAVGVTLAVPSAADQLMVNGKARTYTIAQPATAKGPKPTIIVLHDTKGSGTAIAQSNKLDTLAPQQGFVAVFPDGQNQQWNFFLPGKELDFYVKAMKASGGVADDGAFLKALIVDLVQRGIADPLRIYIAGKSNGSLLALRMICTDANLFAGAALLATGMPETLGADCHPPRPIPVLMIKGTKDEMMPYAGGLVEPSETVRVWSTDKLVGFFQQLDSDTGAPQSSVLSRKVPNFVQIDQWANCPGIPLTVYRVIDGPHIAPPDLNEGQVVLDFFASPVLKSQCVASLQNPASAAGLPLRARIPAAGPTITLVPIILVPIILVPITLVPITLVPISGAIILAPTIRMRLRTRLAQIIPVPRRALVRLARQVRPRMQIRALPARVQVRPMDQTG